MKDYPVDRLMPVIFYPWEVARRLRNRPMKALLAVLGMPWAFLLMMACLPVLLVSIAWAFWDELNDPPQDERWTDD